MTRLAQLSPQERSPNWAKASAYHSSSDASYCWDELPADTFRKIAIMVIDQSLHSSKVRTGIAPGYTVCDQYSRLSNLMVGLVEQGWATSFSQHMESEIYNFKFVHNNSLYIHNLVGNEIIDWNVLEKSNYILIKEENNRNAVYRSQWLDLAEGNPNELTFSDIEILIDLLTNDLNDRKYSHISDNLKIADLCKMSADAVVTISRMISTESENISEWESFVARATDEMARRGEDEELMAGLL